MQKYLKGFICGVLSTVVIGVGVVSATGIWDNINVLRNDIKIVVNGNEITADNFLYNDTTYLPLRAVSEALDKNVTFDEISNTAIISNKEDNNLTNNVISTKNKYSLPDDILNNNKYWRDINGQYFLTLDGVYKYAQKYNLTIEGEDVNDKLYWVFLKNGVEVYRYYEENDQGIHGILYDHMIDIVIPAIEAVQ